MKITRSFSLKLRRMQRGGNFFARIERDYGEIEWISLRMLQNSNFLNEFEGISGNNLEFTVSFLKKIS